MDSDVPVSDSAELEVIVRRWLDLDADHIEAAFGSDELLAPLVAARPGLRVLGSVDGFERFEVSLGARTFGEAFRFRGLAFPDPASIAALSPEDIQKAVGLTTARAKRCTRWQLRQRTASISPGMRIPSNFGESCCR
ncbi:hypothetical protein GCM10020255_017640 [Rhodococcus baikonurensis]